MKEKSMAMSNVRKAMSESIKRLEKEGWGTQDKFNGNISEKSAIRNTPKRAENKICYQPCPPFKDFCNNMNDSKECEQCAKDNNFCDYIE